jgi:ribonuclease I
MMHGLQQIVTQTKRRDNFVVHGLAPPEVKWVISPSL